MKLISCYNSNIIHLDACEINRQCKDRIIGSKALAGTLKDVRTVDQKGKQMIGGNGFRNRKKKIHYHYDDNALTPS